MSRSHLRSQWMKKKHDCSNCRNSHKHDEMPKNVPSRLILEHVDSSKVNWLTHPGSFGGHKPRRGGHRRVSGLVRAALKRELQKQLRKETDTQ